MHFSHQENLIWTFILRSIHDGLDDFSVAGATAEVTEQSAPNFLFAGMSYFVQKSNGSEDHTGCAEAALNRAVVNKRFLQWVQRHPLGYPFNRQNILPLDSDCGDETGVHWLSVDKDNASPTLSVAAPFFGPRKIKAFT
jgi:hypothetical protein